jgi:hypothetical protein
VSGTSTNVVGSLGESPKVEPGKKITLTYKWRYFWR